MRASPECRIWERGLALVPEVLTSGVKRETDKKSLRITAGFDSFHLDEAGICKKDVDCLEVVAQSNTGSANGIAAAVYKAQFVLVIL